MFLEGLYEERKNPLSYDLLAKSPQHVRLNQVAHRNQEAHQSLPNGWQQTWEQQLLSIAHLNQQEMRQKYSSSLIQADLINSTWASQAGFQHKHHNAPFSGSLYTKCLCSVNFYVRTQLLLILNICAKVAVCKIIFNI